eukprot:PITA_07925
MLSSIMECGRISHLSPANHNIHSPCHHGQIKQIKPIGQTFLTIHHLGKITHIQHNGHPPPRRFKTSSRIGKDLPQLPAQPNPNPNNRLVQSVQIIEGPEPETELRECNDLQLRSRCIKESEAHKNVQIENPLPIEQTPQEEDLVRQKTHEQATTSSPPFPKRLIIPRPIEHPDFDLLGELKNLCIKIPLLQAIQDIPIYAKTIKELCMKKPKRKITTNPTVHVVDTLSDLLSGRETSIKYEDPGNPTVTVQINGCSFPNALVDLGAAINIITTTTCQKFGITSLDLTTTLLELADRSVVRPKGTLHDVMMSVDSWEYPANFLIINPRNRLDGHPLILGRP